MKRKLWVGVFAISYSAACNQTVGDCWPVGQNSGVIGAGASVSSTGAGASGDTPGPRPHDITSPAPDCNIVNQDPCHEKCLSDYESAAIVCGRIADDAARKTCQDGAYAAYKNCGDNCTSSSSSCHDKWNDCMDNGPTSCLAQSGGKTLCSRCEERCVAGDSPSAQCKKCKF